MTGVRTPRQSRGQASLERLLDAAELLLSERGPAGVSIAALSERTGLSNGAIYWRVDSIESLLTAVHQRLIQRLRDEHEVYDEPDRSAGRRGAELVAAAVRAEAEICQRHADALRALARSAVTDPRMADRGTQAVREAERRFVEHVAPALRSAGDRHARRTATTIFRMAFGALLNRITWPEQQSDPPIAWPRFVSDLSEMTAAYAAGRIAG